MGRSDRPNSPSLSAVHRKISGCGSLGRSDHEQCAMNLSRPFQIERMFVILEWLALLASRAWTVGVPMSGPDSATPFPFQ